MFSKLLKFELKLHMSQVGFWITFSVMFLLGFLIMSTDVFVVSSGTGERVKMNGAITAALHTSVISLFAIFFGSIYVVSGVMRDEVSKSLEVIHATPVSTFTMTMTRLIGVFVVTFLSMFAGVLGLFIGQFATWIDKDILGPINPLYYIQPTLLFLVINAALVSALFTAVAAVTRNRTLVYVSAVGLFLFYTGAGLFVGEDAPKWLTSIADPFGSSALAITTQFWPADEQNTRMAPLGGYIGLNRLVWGGIALAILASVFGLFRRGLVSGKTKAVAAKPTDLRDTVTSPVFSGTLSDGGLRSLLARTRFEYLSTVKSIAFMILAGMSVALFALVIYVQAKFTPDPLLPTNALMAQSAIGSAFMPLLLIMIFFSGEIIWRDRTHGMTELIDSTRVSNASLMMGKWLALFGVVLTILLVAMLVGIVAQLVLGDVPLNLATHAKIIFGSLAPDLLIYAALLMFIQNFVPGRITGMIVGGGVAIFFFFLVRLIPFYHPLMGFGSIPTGGYSEMNGFGNPLGMRWFGLYWGSLAVLFGAITIWLWRRGLQTGLMSRLKGMVSRITPLTGALAALCVAGFFTAGGAIYKSYNIDNDYQTRWAREADQARFEKLYGDELNKPVPKIRSVEANVQLYPAKETASISGKYVLENTTGAPVSQIFVMVPNDSPRFAQEVSLSGAERVSEGPEVKDLTDAKVRLYRFTTPLAPGATTELAFNVTTPAPELGNDSPIRHNGTFVNHLQVMPNVGLPDFRLVNPDRRRKNGLPELEKAPDRTDMAARQFNFFDKSADYVDFRVTICTDKGQIPIAPGEMLKAYDQDGRVCRDYQPNEPIANFFAFVSSDYAVKEDVWTGKDGTRIPLEIFYHPTHDYNLDLMITAMKQSLDTFTQVFGPYQYKDIRIMEFPYASFAQSFAGTIPFSENIGFMRDPGDPDDVDSLDLASYVTMHEIGHQWFGHQIMPAKTKGFNVLSEGLTENAAMTAYEAAFGWKKARRLLQKQSIDSYLLSRAADPDKEPPLALAENQSYLVYNKASWVFWGLKQTMGEDRMQAAIRGFLEEYGRTGPPYPTTKELVDALRAAAGPDYQQRITDYWDRIVFWDLQLKGDEVKVSEAGGKVTVDLTVHLDKKIASEETGKETSVADIDGETLDEWVEIGFYAEDPKKTLGGDWLRLEKVRLDKAETNLSYTFDEKPAYVLLDPRRLLMERNVDDNVFKLSDSKPMTN